MPVHTDHRLAASEFRHVGQGFEQYPHQQGLDRESFQKLLAAAFTVQESRIETQSLSAIVEVQRLITSGDLDLDAAMHLIADRTRNAAGATGVAIGLLQGDQLVYRAGSGSAAAYTGRQVTATLSVSANTKTSREILCVEDAQTDARIEAAICRQYGAQALLILLICDDRAVAGVLEIFFSEAHSFQDGEVRTYRLMAGLIGEAMSHAAQLARKKALAPQLPSVPHAIQQMTSQLQKFPSAGRSVPEPPNQHAIYQACRAVLAAARELPSGAVTMIMQRVKGVRLHPRWSAAMAAVVALVMVGWIANSHRRSNALEQPVPFVAAKAAPAASTTKPRAARTALRRVQVGDNEVDYVSEDVTIRYFTRKPAPELVRVGHKRVDIGEDVTVRYFAQQPMDPSLPVPENSASPKLAR